MNVCVIGAGAAGLVAIRRINSTAGISGTVYEQSSDIGGIWCYPGTQEPENAAVSPMYKNLRTNLPREVMQYLDFPFVKGQSSFVTHEEVNEYLNEYADHFRLRGFIQLRKRVSNVKPLTVSSNTTAGRQKWEVEVEDLETGAKTLNEFDAVIVCNGHFYKPVLPIIPNIELFGGTVFHSREYHDPEVYANKVVVVVGCGPSAVDISLEIASVAREVIQCFRVVPETPPLAQNVVNVGPIVEVKLDGFVFHGNVKKRADVLILATGYEYDYPFLDPSCEVIVEKGKLVTPVYRHLIHTKFPSLCFVGLPVRIIPFYLFDIQVRYFLEFLTGNVVLPSQQEMDRAWRQDVESRRASGLPHSQAHMLGAMQWEYYECLAKEAGFDTELNLLFRKIFHHVENRRREFPSIYKGDNVEVVDGKEPLQRSQAGDRIRKTVTSGGRKENWISAELVSRWRVVFSVETGAGKTVHTLQLSFFRNIQQ